MARTAYVEQSGTITPNHAVKWITNGVVGDGGAISSINSVLVTGLVVSQATRNLAVIATIPSNVTAIQTYGYAAVGDGGGALYTKTVSLTSGGFQSADGAFWELSDQIITPEMFGATGDGSTDDTAALQAAVTYVTELSAELLLGGNRFNAPADYKISSAITIAFSTNWKIHGCSRGSAIITQATDNTPIFTFTANFTHSWSISDLTLVWTNAQPYSNTSAVGIYFTGNNFNRYNFQIHRVLFANGFRSIANDPAVTALTWGADIRDCVHGGSMSGSFANFTQAVFVGQPNNSIENCYIDAAGMIADPVIYIVACDTVWLNNIEVNNIVNGNNLLHIASSTGAIGCVKVEVGSWSSQTLILIEDSNLFIGMLGLYTLTTTGFCKGINVGGAGGRITVGSCILSFASLTGTFYLCQGPPAPASEIRFINSPIGLLGQAGAFLSDVSATITANAVSVEAWQQQRLSDDNGDADASWTLGTSPTVMQFLTTLTADRTLTLTDQPNGADSNLYNGFVLTVTRNAATPGAFKLLIKQANTATIGTIDSTNGSISFMWQRLEWRVINYTTWSGTAP